MASRFPVAELDRRPDDICLRRGSDSRSLCVPRKIWCSQNKATIAERQSTNSFMPHSFQPEPEIPQARLVFIVKFGRPLRFLIPANKHVEPDQDILRLASD